MPPPLQLPLLPYPAPATSDPVLVLPGAELKGDLLPMPGEDEDFLALLDSYSAVTTPAAAAAAMLLLYMLPPALPPPVLLLVLPGVVLPLRPSTASTRSSADAGTDLPGPVAPLPLLLLNPALTNPSTNPAGSGDCALAGSSGSSAASITPHISSCERRSMLCRCCCGLRPCSSALL